MHLKLLVLSTILLSGQVYSQSFNQMTTSVRDASTQILDYTREHFSAAYHGEIYAVRRDIDSLSSNDSNLKDFKILHNPTLIYKPTMDWQAMATAEFKYSDQPSARAGADYPNGFFRGLFTITRKNILSEKENGVHLDVGLGRRQYNTGREQQADGKFALSSYGNNRIFATVSKSMGKHNASLFAQFLNNDIKNNTAATWKNSVELIPTINIQLTESLSYLFNDDIVINLAKNDNTARSYSITHDMNLAYLNFQWNDKINTYYQFKYEHNENFTRKFQAQDDYFLHYVGMGYAFTPKATVALEAGSEIFHARDGRDVFAKNVLYPELALYLDFAI